MFNTLIKYYNPNLNNIRATDKHVSNRFLSLPDNKDNFQITYIWIDGTGKNLRSKTMTLSNEPSKIEELPWWNFDGSSTNQAYGNNSDVYLKPVAIYNDPFTLSKNKLVFCDTYSCDMKPTEQNKRLRLLNAIEKSGNDEPVFKIEQEYTIVGQDRWPLGWPNLNGFRQPGLQYTCSIGTAFTIGHDIAVSHYKACLFAGIKITSISAAEHAAKWKFKIEKVKGCEAYDQLWVSRYILQRIAEDFGFNAVFDNKITEKDVNLKKHGVLVIFQTTKRLKNSDKNCPVQQVIETFLMNI